MATTEPVGRGRGRSTAEKVAGTDSPALWNLCSARVRQRLQIDAQREGGHGTRVLHAGQHGRHGRSFTRGPHRGKFAAVPLQSCDEDAAIMASASAEVRANTLPRQSRSGYRPIEMFADSCTQLDEIASILSSNEPTRWRAHQRRLSHSSVQSGIAQVLKEMLRSIKFWPG